MQYLLSHLIIIIIIIIITIIIIFAFGSKISRELKTEVKNIGSWRGHLSQKVSCGRQPRNDMQLKRCIATERRCAVSRDSPVMLVRRRPSSDMNDNPFELMGPNVSNASGTNLYEFARCWYFSFLRSAAPSAAPP